MAGWTVAGYTATGVSAPGAGDDGRVAEAVQDATGARVLITYPDPRLGSDEAFRERFRTEMELLRDVDHPNVVRVRELVATETGLALITDAVQGAALRRVLATSGPLSPEAALAVLRGSLSGLGAAQEAGVVHRDYQPSNVLVSAEGVCRVTGFGLAVRTEAMMPAAGTPSYMAPELWEGASPRSVTDIYAVTATFYECLTGRVPYTAESVFELQTLHRAAPIPAADVPAALAPLLALGLAKAPVERPADAAGFLAELEAAAAVAYGLEWEERGRRELAALVARVGSEDGVATSVLPAVAGGVGVGVGVGVGEVPSIWADDSAPESLGDDGERMGRGTKIGISVAVVAVIGAVLAAVAFSPGKHAAATAGPSGEIVSASDTSSVIDGSSPGLAAGAGPTPGSRSSDSGASPTQATSGSSATSSATAKTPPTSGPGATPIGVPLPSSSSVGSLPSYPSAPPPSSGSPTTSAGGSTPPTTPSVTVTVSASATMKNSTYSGPCPPTDPPTGTVTFTVSGLPSGSSEAISYHWRVAGGGAGGGWNSVNAQDGSTTEQFTVSDDPHSQKGLSGTVEVDWSAPGTSGGAATAGSVDIKCTGGGTGGGPGGTGGGVPTSGASS
ncbi:protein kinase domain-containing protein [Catenulispora pinisilvae]|uniref:protein kinase domain-containing protein n=1 Tax=Catenulispora pinisilvae TaxID=2705253 RepID=UPI0018927C35|nr:serine/threonine-protein kinase [Catenulispora pinisilvae]